MGHIEKLAAIGKGYRYAWREGSPNLALHPPGMPLGTRQTYATDAQIEDWIDQRVACGDGTRAEIEADLEARRADVASGYEDRMRGAVSV